MASNLPPYMDVCPECESWDIRSTSEVWDIRDKCWRVQLQCRECGLDWDDFIDGD